MIQTVVKRDGRVVGYNEEKIKAAIRKAMLQTELGEDEALIHKITDRIGFNDIYDTIAHTLATTEHVASPDYADYVAVNDQSRRLAAEHIARLEASTSR